MIDALSNLKSPPPLPPLGMKSKLKHKVSEAVDVLHEDVALLATKAMKQTGVIRGGGGSSTQITTLVGALVGVIVLGLSLWMASKMFSARRRVRMPYTAPSMQHTVLSPAAGKGRSKADAAKATHAKDKKKKTGKDFKERDRRWKAEMRRLADDEDLTDSASFL